MMNGLLLFRPPLTPPTQEGKKLLQEAVLLTLSLRTKITPSLWVKIFLSIVYLFPLLSRRGQGWSDQAALTKEVNMCST